MYVFLLLCRFDYTIKLPTWYDVKAHIFLDQLMLWNAMISRVRLGSLYLPKPRRARYPFLHLGNLWVASSRDLAHLLMGVWAKDVVRGLVFHDESRWCESTRISLSPGYRSGYLAASTTGKGKEARWADRSHHLLVCHNKEIRTLIGCFYHMTILFIFIFLNELLPMSYFKIYEQNTERYSSDNGSLASVFSQTFSKTSELKRKQRVEIACGWNLCACKLSIKLIVKTCNKWV